MAKKVKKKFLTADELKKKLAGDTTKNKSKNENFITIEELEDILTSTILPKFEEQQKINSSINDNIDVLSDFLSGDKKKKKSKSYEDEEDEEDEEYEEDEDDEDENLSYNDKMNKAFYKGRL